MTTSTDTDLDVTVERRPGSQVHLAVEAPAADVDRAIDTALRRFGQRIRIPGFRPGKAPLPMIESHLGWEAVRGEAVEELVPALYMRILDQEQLEPVGDPAIDLDAGTIERGKPVKFAITVTVRPEVDLGDYLGLRVDPITTEVTDKDVDEAIEDVRRRHSELTTADRPAQIGDVLTCVLEMRHGEELLTAAGQERELELDPEQLLAGLADNIVGMKAGEDRTFTLKLPDDYPREELREQEVSVTCAVREVKERALPPLDDSLAVLDKRGDTLQEMRDFYKAALEDQARHGDVEKYEAAVLTAFSDLLSVEIPEVMIDNEVDRQIRELAYRFESMGIPWSQYLAMTQQTEEQLRAERRQGAVQRVRLELGLDTLIKAEGIEVDESAVEREEKRMASGQKLTASQRRRLHQMAHVDLARQAAGQRLLEIARGEG